MLKQEFLNELEHGLMQLPPEERERHLSYYSEILDDRMEDGQEEAEAAASLGSPAELADQVLRETPLPVLVRSRVKPQRGWTVATIVLAVIGSPIWLPVCALLLCVVLAVYACIWAVIVTLFACVVAIGASGIGALLSPFFGFAATTAGGLLLVGGGLILAGVSIVAFLGALAAAKGLVKLTAAFARWIKSLFIKKEAVK